MDLTFATAPTTNPDAAWLAGRAGEHIEVLALFAEACWAMAAYRAQADMRGVAANWQTRRGQHIATKADLFEHAVTARRSSLLIGFFELTSEQMNEIARLPASNANQQRIKQEFLAQCDRQTVQEDLYGQALPAPLYDVLALIETTPPYRSQGLNGLTKRLRLSGKPYFAKTTEEEMSGIPPVGQDEYHMVTTTAALHALCPEIGPSAAYHLIAANGDHSCLVAALPGRPYAESSARLVASLVDVHWLQWIVLAEWLFGTGDRLAGNLVVDKTTRRAGMIDMTFSWHMLPTFLGWEDGQCFSFARQVWELQDSMLRFPRQLLTDALVREQAVCSALTAFQFTLEARLRQQFAVLQAALSHHSGEIPLKTLEQIAQSMVH